MVVLPSIISSDVPNLAVLKTRKIRSIERCDGGTLGGLLLEPLWN